MMTTLKSSFKIGATLLTLMLGSEAFAEAPSYVRVRGISYAGSGCPAGSVADILASDYRAFTLLFDSYIAEVGPGVPIREKRKNCQINVDLDFPSGWSYTLFTVDYRGYVALDRGVTALQQSRYYFQGSAVTGTLKTNMVGPIDRDYQIRDTLAVNAEVWSPCGASRSLNINTEVRADNARNRYGQGMITLDSLDGQLQHIYGIKWRRCR